MISPEEILKIHTILIEQFGGIHGLRDSELLESALSRPFQTFDGKDLYPSPIEKSAAIIESIIKNHPFIDGNKRTGYLLGRLFLMNAGFDFTATLDERYEFIIQISTSKLNFDQIKEWIQNNSQG
jgi:death-on-curing protein